MSTETWSAVDHFLGDFFVPADEALDEALRASDAAGLPAIAVSAVQGKLLHLLARIHGARRILEIGTLGGYSTIWLARALPTEGHVVSLEFDPRHAEVARANMAHAGLASKVDVRVGKALDTLPSIAEETSEPFDFFFIDADKENNPAYFDWALRLSRPGSVIVIDNVVRGGRVIDGTLDDKAIQGTRRVLERMGREPRVSATAIQTVGTKGYDGFAIAVVNR